MKNFISSISLVIIGILYILLSLPSPCSSSAEDLFSSILAVMFFVNLIIVLISGYLKRLNRRTKFNFIPVYVSAVLVATVLLVKLFSSETFKSPVMISALSFDGDSIKVRETSMNYMAFSLILRENKQYSIIGFLPEASCTYGGKYLMNHDTIVLYESLMLSSEPSLANKYVIDSARKFLKPLNPGTNQIEYNKWWFEIVKMNSP
jgi:hypothetical protein